MTDQPTIPTVKQTDVTKAGQRRINLLWECTQAAIALSVTWSLIYCELNRIESIVLKNAFFLVVAMYLIRTNHTLTGGVGPKNINETR